MKDTGIFKYIWRLNALLILVAGIALVSLIFIEFWDKRENKTRTRAMQRERREMQLDDSPRLGLAFRVGDSSNFVFSLSPGGHVQGRRWLPSDVVHNFLFVDGETNGRRWLFEANGPLIQKWDQIEVEQGLDVEPLVLGLVYHTIETDSDGDGTLNPGDGGSLMYSDIDGGNLCVLLASPIYNPTFHVAGRRLFCTYETDEGLSSAVFELGKTPRCLDKGLLPASPEGGV